jgi:hypothetical protein
MSRPYININSASYNSTTDVITFDVTALRLRGETLITVGGFTESRSISLTDGRFLTEESGYFTFSANVNGTSSNNLTGANGVLPTFTPATAVFEFGGTATGAAGANPKHGTNIKIQVWGSGTTASGATTTYNIFGTGGYTFSATQSSETAVATLASNISSLPTGATATTSGSSLIITAPVSTGAYYNGNNALILPAMLGTASNAWTYSTTYYSGTWSGGVTTVTVPVTATNFGEIETHIFNIS